MSQRVFRRRPYRVECTGSLSTSEVKQHRARLVLGWGTAWEDLRVLSAFSSFTGQVAKSSPSFGDFVTQKGAASAEQLWAAELGRAISPGFATSRLCIFKKGYAPRESSRTTLFTKFPPPAIGHAKGRKKGTAPTGRDGPRRDGTGRADGGRGL